MSSMLMLVILATSLLIELLAYKQFSAQFVDDRSRHTWGRAVASAAIALTIGLTATMVAVAIDPSYSYAALATIPIQALCVGRVYGAGFGLGFGLVLLARVAQLLIGITAIIHPAFAPVLALTWFVVLLSKGRRTARYQAFGY